MKKIVSLIQRMRMTREEYNILYEKYVSQKCTDEERKVLEAYEDTFESSGQKWDRSRMGDKEVIKQTIYNELKTSIANHARSRTIWLSNWSAAAAIALILISGGLYLNSLKDNQVATNLKPLRFKNDILPGNNKAILTLHDGFQINLDDAKNGILVRESNMNIEKVLEGQLEYKADDANQTVTQLKYNTLSTPIGGQYQLILPDGSKVWLNAGSSLRFPTAFVGKERRVELSGEAYFEVSKNKAMPFKVFANDMEVRVLGTHFNVMAYDNEKSINTTLIEGSVQVLIGTGRVYLKPGEEAILNKTSSNMTVSAADVEQIVAWKNGYFMFNDENIESIMRKVSRWYNVDVTFKGSMKNKDFVGTMLRNRNVSELLRMLELTGAVHFSIEGRRITVMP